MICSPSPSSEGRDKDRDRDKQIEEVALLPLTSRINHSCRPNSMAHWDPATRTWKVYAKRGIEAGEEITATYIPLLKTREERRSRLTQYGFSCHCSVCNSSSSSVAESDRRRLGIAEIVRGLARVEVEINDETEENKMKTGDRKGKAKTQARKRERKEKWTRKAEEMVRMVEDEGLVGYLAKSYRYAAVMNRWRGDVGRALMWAEKELGVLRWAGEGEGEGVY